ncbi:hypothetical protein ACHQM5_010778 [Ranunculus cassubicifolius]
MASSGTTSKRYELLKAAIDGDLATIKKLAKEIDNVAEITDGLGITSLHIAAAHGYTDICKFFINDLKLDVNMQDGQDCTPLHHASLGGFINTAIYLLKKGADPGIGNMIGITPLHYAAEIGHVALLQLLLSRGANVDAMSSYGTPLQRAASEGKHETLKILLDHNANTSLSTRRVATALLESVTVKSFRCVDLLLKAGADPNITACGVMPLEQAASQGETKMIARLLKAGANPNVTNEEGQTPIEIAALSGNLQAVQLLFPVTSRIPFYPDWSIGGILKHVASEEAIAQRELIEKGKIGEAKRRGDEAFREKDYNTAIAWYSKATEVEPSNATVLSNRSLCWARLNEGTLAIKDAMDCIKLKPEWSKGYYRAGVAWNIMEDFNRAADAFFMGLKLDPQNAELRNAFQEAKSKSVNMRP